jgi:hypothetical protein
LSYKHKHEIESFLHNQIHMTSFNELMIAVSQS